MLAETPLFCRRAPRGEEENLLNGKEQLDVRDYLRHSLATLAYCEARPRTSARFAWETPAGLLRRSLRTYATSSTGACLWFVAARPGATLRQAPGTKT